MNKSCGNYNIFNEHKINESIKNVLSSCKNFNEYSSPKGICELREKICSCLEKEWNTQLNYKEMLITTGSQQSLKMLCELFLGKKEKVLVEQPTYYGMLNILKEQKIKAIGFNIENDGPSIKEFEQLVVKHKPKLVYVIPTFNNPTGICWSNKKRIEFLKIINKYNITVIEDDPYSLINFTKTKYKSLYSLNNGKNIIYLGTFSKYITPSINVGYILSKNNIAELYKIKENFDLCTPLFSQLFVLDYLNNNNLSEQINNKVNIYKSLYNKAMTYLKEQYGNQIISISKNKGGLFFLVKFKTNLLSNEFCDANNFYISGDHSNETRINICSFL